MGKIQFNDYFISKDGKNSAFRKQTRNNTLYLEKYFSYNNEEERLEKIHVTNQIIKLKNDSEFLLPEDLVYYNDISVGYLIECLEDSLNFNENTSQITYKKRLEACINTSIELQYFHSQNLIHNDIKLANHILSPENGQSALIDFEDMILMTEYKIKATTYRFYKKNSYEIKPPSFNEDVKKQFICHLSLLFQENFEYYVIELDEWSFLERLKIYKPLYEIGQLLFHDDELIYFHNIKKIVEDEEKIMDLKRKMIK